MSILNPSLLNFKNTFTPLRKLISNGTNLIHHSEDFVNWNYTSGVTFTEMAEGLTRIEYDVTSDLRNNYTGFTYAADNYSGHYYSYLALTPVLRKRLFIGQDQDGRKFYTIVNAKCDGTDSFQRINFAQWSTIALNLVTLLRNSISGTSIIVDYVQTCLIDETKLPNPGTIVCLGDSITTQYPTHLAYLLPGATVVNSGVGGNLISDAIARFTPDVAAHTPDVILLMIGTNDIGQGATVADIKADYMELLSMCAGTGAGIIIGNITPRGGTADPSETINLKIVEINAWLKTVGYPVVDHYSDFLSDTPYTMWYNCTDDGIHPHRNLAYNYLAENFALALGWKYPKYVKTLADVIE